MKLLLVGVVLLGGLATLFIPIGGSPRVAAETIANGFDISGFSDKKPANRLRLLFIHHSVGGALLADPGEVMEESTSILRSHPEGGGLRSLLEANQYEVHEASYGSKIGDKTDLLDWESKFGNDMDEILKCDQNDTFYTDGRRNRIVMFKSCYPNSRFMDEGELTIAKAKASLSELLSTFSEKPDTLFVYLTAPPMAERAAGPTRMWKYLARKALKKPDLRALELDQSARAREFNNWVKSPDGWLKDYALKNVAVFDLFDSLTDHGKSNLLQYPSGPDKMDSHPTKAGNIKAAQELVPFLNRAVRRAGLSD